jgi:hypothetical protein
MSTIEHLTTEEKMHYILCDCGEYIDMRDLSQVFSHLHQQNIAEPNWSYCVKKGEAKAYLRSGEQVDLN